MEKPEPVEPQAGEGVVQLPMTSTTSEGVQYRLVGATFTITGPKAVTISDTSPDTVSVVLPAGAYSIRLEGQWHIERTDAPGQAVPASLLSPNPMAFSLDEGQTRAVRFIFKTPGNATADVGITVDTGGWVTGTLDFDADPSPEDPNILRPLAGTSLPFAISWSTATVYRIEEIHTVNVITGPIAVQFGGPYSELVHDRIARTLTGMTLRFEVRVNGGAMFNFSGIEFNDYQYPTEPIYLSLEQSLPFIGVVDEQGMPAARPFNVEVPMTLRDNAGPFALGYLVGRARLTVFTQ